MHATVEYRFAIHAEARDEAELERRLEQFSDLLAALNNYSLPVHSVEIVTGTIEHHEPEICSERI